MHTTTSQPLPPQRHHAPELHGAFADDGNPRTDNTTWYRSEDLPNRTAPLVDRSSHPHPHPYGKEPLFVAVNPFRASSARGWGRVARPVHLVAPSPVAVDIPEIPFPDDMPQTSSVAFRRRIRRARAGSRAQHDILPAAAVIHTQPLPANRFYGFTANVEPGPLPPPRSRSSSPTSSTPSPSVLAVPSASAHSIASDNPPPASRHTRSSPRHRSRSRSRSIRGFVHERESRSRRRRGSRSRSRTPPISMHGRESRSRSPRRSSTSIICMRESRSRSQSIKTPPPSAMEGSYPRSHRPPVPPVIVAGDPRSRDRTPPPVLKSHRSRSRSPRWISAEQEAQGFRWVPDRPLGIHTSHEITDLPPSEGLPVPATSKKASRLNIYLALQTVVLIACAFVFDSAPRRLYLHFLLRIPSLYFSRVARIFEDAQLSLPDIKRMARATADQWNTKESPTMFLAHHDQMMLPRSLLNFRSSWEGFIDSLMREWKTLNIISVLLLSAILTMLQIDAAANPITRTSALFSLICALMSLLYGCMYIIRFGTMRKMHKASSFANEAQKDTTNIWWNVWVLLAMPAIWLSWSIIMFFMSIMSFIWLSGTADDPVGFTMSSRAALGPRIGLTVVFSLGLIYFALIVKTFHRYGDALDREWMRTVNEWTREGSYTAPRWYRPAPPRSHHTPPRTIDGHLTPTKVVLPTQWTADNAQHVSRAVSPTSSRHERKRDFFKLPPSSPLTTHPSVFFATPNGPESSPPPSFDPITTMQLGYPDAQAYVMAHLMPAHIVKPEIWNRFMTDVSCAWNGQLALTPPVASADSAGLPEYALLQPARPGNPIAVSADSAGLFIADAAGNHSVDSSESACGNDKPSMALNSLFTLATPGPGSASAEIVPSISAPVKRRLSSLAELHTKDDTSNPRASDTANGDRRNTAQAVCEFIDLWNERYFHPRAMEASLVPLTGSDGPSFAVNLASCRSPTSLGPGNVRVDDTVPDIPSAATGSPEDGLLLGAHTNVRSQELARTHWSSGHGPLLPETDVVVFGSTVRTCRGYS